LFGRGIGEEGRITGARVADLLQYPVGAALVRSSIGEPWRYVAPSTETGPPRVGVASRGPGRGTPLALKRLVVGATPPAPSTTIAPPRWMTTPEGASLAVWLAATFFAAALSVTVLTLPGVGLAAVLVVTLCEEALSFFTRTARPEGPPRHP
jgi:hypothetical protein